MNIKNLMMEYDVILASASPRRKELMQLICPSFRVIPADCGEAVPEALSACDVPGFLSFQKCKCIAQVLRLGGPVLLRLAVKRLICGLHLFKEHILNI